MISMLVVVHLNTTVHPFTLADNRHYMFYVFRLLLRHRPIKYAVVPIYFYCAFATTAAFGSMSDTQEDLAQKSSSIRTPYNFRDKIPPVAEAHQFEGPRVSLVLLWLCATTLSLVTAPLVEPRYFIIPWLIWRLHIHGPRGNLLAGIAEENNDVEQKGFSNVLEAATHFFGYVKYGHHLWLESAWFLFINWVTTHIFLYWGFEWPQEPGQVQRFMW